MDDPSQLLEAATDFAYYPGVQSDDSVRDFLNRFPLPLIINALQTQFDVPGLENALVACLERLFKTKLGASLIPQYMPFVQVGLQADSQAVRSLACKTVTCLLENIDNDYKVAAHLITEFNIYPLLLDCLINGNEQVAAAAMDAIKKLAGFAEGMEIIFPSTKGGDTDLGIIASQCSSLGRVRVLALVVKLFSVSRSAASTINSLNLLKLLEAEIRNTDDTLVTLSVLELLYEAALHALGNISGETRSENNVILNAEAEENLRRLVYEKASRSSKLTPSGLFVSVLQQDSEIRLAGYRMISGLVARPWCLMEICSKQDIINIVTDPTTETTKIGMEARYNCCKAINKSLAQSSRVSADPAFAGIAAKEAVGMGPYLVRKHVEAQPIVKTAERF
ncbi:Armadillo-type fold [Sesbania bispinosa]|nr:Armadillo-type fold [Sesbania bispinosa]